MAVSSLWSRVTAALGDIFNEAEGRIERAKGQITVTLQDIASGTNAARPAPTRSTQPTRSRAARRTTPPPAAATPATAPASAETFLAYIQKNPGQALKTIYIATNTRPNIAGRSLRGLVKKNLVRMEGEGDTATYWPVAQPQQQAA